jgi:hypothetical protein
MPYGVTPVLLEMKILNGDRAVIAEEGYSVEPADRASVRALSA